MTDLNNLFKAGQYILHQNASRLKVNLEPVPVLPKVFEILPKLKNLKLFVIKNLADGTTSSRVPSLTKSARDVECLDLVQAQVPVKAESRTDLSDESRIEQFRRFKLSLLGQRIRRFFDLVQPLGTGFVKSDEGVVGVDGIFEFDFALGN